MVVPVVEERMAAQDDMDIDSGQLSKSSMKTTYVAVQFFSLALTQITFQVGNDSRKWNSRSARVSIVRCNGRHM